MIKDFSKYFIVGTNSDALHDTMNGSVVGELIRCRDCKYARKIYIKNLPWLKQWEYSCVYSVAQVVMGDGFCSYAERKENKS